MEANFDIAVADNSIESLEFKQLCVIGGGSSRIICAPDIKFFKEWNETEERRLSPHGSALCAIV